jgi:hypothetical protein
LNFSRRAAISAASNGRGVTAEAVQILELRIHAAEDQPSRALGAGFDRIALAAAAFDLAQEFAQLPVEGNRVPDRGRDRAGQYRDSVRAEATLELGGRDVPLVNHLERVLDDALEHRTLDAGLLRAGLRLAGLGHAHSSTSSE